MKKMLVVLASLALAAPVFAQSDLNDYAGGKVDGPRIVRSPINPEGNNRMSFTFEDSDRAPGAQIQGEENIDYDALNEALRVQSLAGSNLINHGGPVISHAHVVCIFWGPTWNNSSSSDYSYARTIQAFRNQFGTSSHWAMLSQYGVSQNNLQGSQPDWFDTTNALPSNGRVSDSVVQSEVKRYISAHGYDSSAIYEVYTPRYVPGTTTPVYSYDSGSTSCGGTNLAYCAYHSSYSSTSGYVKYSIEPYPSCSGCQWTGWSTVQNMEHFATHETREAATDALGTAWYDSSGNEADDKCAWTGLFISNGYGYQPEWSNSAGGCVQ